MGFTLPHSPFYGRQVNFTISLQNINSFWFVVNDNGDISFVDKMCSALLLWNAGKSFVACVFSCQMGKWKGCESHEVCYLPLPLSSLLCHKAIMKNGETAVWMSQSRTTFKTTRREKVAYQSPLGGWGFTDIRDHLEVSSLSQRRKRRSANLRNWHLRICGLQKLKG